MFLIVSIDVIADDGTWAVSVCCMVTASCVPHVGVWTIGHRNVVGIKVSLYIWPCYRLLIASAQTRCAPNSRQLLSLLELSGEIWGLTVVFWDFAPFWIPSDTCFKVNSRRVELFARWCNYKQILIIRCLLLNMAGVRRRSAAARLPRDCGFESQWGYGCFSVVGVVYCQVEVCATSWSLVQRSRCVLSRNLVNVETLAHWGCRAPPPKKNKRVYIINKKWKS